MALFYQKGTISDFSEVQSGKTQSGNEWQRMTLILDTPGFQGAVYKMVFQVSGDHVKDVLLFKRGDKVEISFSIYAREWKGRWYNNVDLVKIKSLDEQKQEEKPAPAHASKQPAIFDQPQESLDPADNPNDLPF